MKELKMSKEGVFFAIEGTDGSGKAEQVDLARRRFKEEGFRVEVADFPRYNKESSGPVKMYLRGELGSINEVGARQASVLYAVDRFCAAPQIKKWLSDGSIVLSNRYVASNLGHQGSKIPDNAERKKFWAWELKYEYEFFNIPRPDLNIILYVDPEISYKLVEEKSAREYLKGKKRDIHEEDIEHLRKAIEVYKQLANEYPEQFELINCSPEGAILTRKEIHNLVWEKIEPFLK